MTVASRPPVRDIPFAHARHSVLSGTGDTANAARRPQSHPLDRSPTLAPSPTTAYLLVALAGTTCALARDEVREILPLPHLHRPPAAGMALAGFLDLGGVPVPVIDLPRLLALRPVEPMPGDDDPYRHVVLAADGGTAFLVDRVEDVVRVAAQAVAPVSGGRTFNGCVVAELAWRDGLVPVLSVARILTIEEQGRIAGATRREAERLAALPAA